MSSLWQSFYFSLAGLSFTGGLHWLARVFYFDGYIVPIPPFKKIDHLNYSEVGYGI